MARRKCAVFTIQQNERFHLPLWLAYYGQFFEPQDMYVLDHDSTDPATRETLSDFDIAGGNIEGVHHDTTFDHAWLLNTVHRNQRILLSDYEYVLFTDCDEWVMPEDGDLKAYIDALDGEQKAYRATGFEVIEDKQRRWPLFDKTLLTRVPLLYINGYHESVPTYPYDERLFLYHMHRLDRQAALDKRARWSETQVDPLARANAMGWQNWGLLLEEFDPWFCGDNEEYKGQRMGEPTEYDERLAKALQVVRS